MRKIDPYKVAAIQLRSKRGDKEHNIGRLLDLSGEAAKSGAKLIVFPEMGTTGYAWADRGEIAPFVETIPGPTTDLFSDICSEHGCYIAVGMPEEDGVTGLYYNSLAFIGPEGLIGTYRKTHSNIAEPRWAADGDLGFAAWNTTLGRIAGLICMDMCYVEPPRIAAIRGCDLIVFPSGWLDIKAPSPLWLAAARLNGLYIVAADSWGEDRGLLFSGGSCVIGPDGTIQSRIDVGDGIAYGEIDLRKAAESKGAQSLKARRPKTYKAMLHNTFLWPPESFQSLYGSRKGCGKQVRVGVVQFLPGKDVQLNVSRATTLINEISENADLVVLPELAIEGSDEASKREQTQAIEQLRGMAASMCVDIVTSVWTRSGSGWNHTAVLVGAEGVRAAYDQVHLEENSSSCSGDVGFRFFDMPWGRLGLLLGRDLLYPESVLSLASLGCDLICVPARLTEPRAIGVEATEIPFPEPTPTGDDPHHFILWRVLAEQSNTFLAVANCPGPAYAGCSGVFGPDLELFPRNEIVIPEDEEGARSILIDIAGSDAVRSKPGVRMRQIHLYRELVAR